MSANNLTKCAAAAFAAVACACVMSSVGAAELNAAYSNPFSAPCHPSTDRGACLKHSEPAAEGLRSGVTPLAKLQNVPTDSDPVSSPCHPSAERAACLKHTKHTADNVAF